MFKENIIDPIINSCNSFPTLNAFCINEIFYTYANLSERISAIRNAISQEIADSKIIGLVANDDLDTYASIIAIWLEGFAYVPLHPQQPLDRNMDIANQAGVDLIINSDFKYSFGQIKCLDTSSIETGNAIPETIIPDDTELAYILFTSGSTGKPKGVPITRENIGAFMKSFWEVGFQIDQNDRCLQCFDLTFDVSVQSFLVPLTKGACVYTIPHDQIKYSYVYGLLEDHKLTFGAMAPSMIRFLRPYFDEIDAQSFRYNILTAEASPLDLVEEWSKCIPNAEIFDFYGPTEATIYCTYYKFQRNHNSKHLNGMLSIGKPMNGLTAIIIDDSKKILPANVKGEMCISGLQLTPGYWNNSEKNTSSFFVMNLDGIDTRYYKTGDLCYIDDEGDIMYAGRIDYQVKIQGYRIELGEIEFHARLFLQGINATAIPFENSTGNTEIALFIESLGPNSSEIQEYLKLHLPYYMIPGKIINIDQFPLNANGKTDRNMLKNLINNHNE